MKSKFKKIKKHFRNIIPSQITKMKSIFNNFHKCHGMVYLNNFELQFGLYY